MVILLLIVIYVVVWGAWIAVTAAIVDENTTGFGAYTETYTDRVLMFGVVLGLFWPIVLVCGIAAGIGYLFFQGMIKLGAQLRPHVPVWVEKLMGHYTEYEHEEASS